MKTQLQVLVLILGLIGIIGCETGGAGAGAAAKPGMDLTPTPTPGGPTPTPIVTNVTYYSLDRTEAPVNGWPLKTYTATGYCAVYQTKTYCWDDGVKTIPAWSFNNFFYGPYTYSYWERGGSGGAWSFCHGGCVQDPLTLPVYTSNTVVGYLSTTAINLVFSSGTPHQVTCTESNGQLTCGGFTVDLNQTAL